MPNSNIAITAGAGTMVDTFVMPNGDHRQYMIDEGHGGFRGRFVTPRTPGRAATAHNLAALHNATASAVTVDVEFVAIDIYQTVIKAVTVPPSIIRLSRFTAVPTGGTAATKTSLDTSFASSASVTAWQDASAEGTSSATALTITPGSGITQEFAPRMITAAGYEPADRVEFMNVGKITLRPLEGVVLHAVSVAGTSEPVTDMYIATMAWEEYA